MKRFSWLGTLAVAATLALSAGCNTFTYFEIDTKLDQLTFSNELAGQIAQCRVTVSGAAADEFSLSKRCPPVGMGGLTRHDVGVIEYATFASEGTMTFTLRLYRGTGQSDKIGEGSVDLPVTEGKTIMGMLKVIGMGTATNPPMP